MRGIAYGIRLSAFALAMMVPTLAAADSFEPKVSLVCVKSRTGGLVVDRARLIALQVQAKIAPIQLRPDAVPVTPEMQAAALLNPEEFCKANGCSPEIAAKLGSAFVVLNAFLVANSGPYGTSYRVAGQVSAETYLAEPAGGDSNPVPVAFPRPASRCAGTFRGGAPPLLRHQEECRRLPFMRKRMKASRSSNAQISR
ncbi:MAG: hypothetical protein ACM3MH_11145 [Actinomycetota bacterium]